MTTTTMMMIAALVLLVIGGTLGMTLSNFMRTQRLKDRFGDEYDRTVDKSDDRREAEDELDGRLERAQKLKIRPLTAKEVNRFVLEWQAVQADFVDHPREAVKKADNLIREVMSTRGYPMEDFDQRVADISVEHPDLVENYRQLHAIAKKDEKEKVRTEEMRQAMVRGRDLFDSLVQPDGEKEERTPEKENA